MQYTNPKANKNLNINKNEYTSEYKQLETKRYWFFQNWRENEIIKNQGRRKQKKVKQKDPSQS